MPGWLGSPDWAKMFVPSQPVLETVVRGSLMYLYLFWLLRIFRRQTGGLAPADLLVLVLIADASQNGLAGQYSSLTDGLLLVTTIVAWEYALDAIAFHIPALRPYIERSPLTLIRDGQPLRANLRRELITNDELQGTLREHGVESLSEVRSAILEGNGRVSVCRTDHQQDTSPPRQSVT